MGKVKVAVNGFGRIGRLIFRRLILRDDIEVVAINDLSDNATLAHLLKYDTAHGRFDQEISHDDAFIYVNGKQVHALAEPEPTKLPWEEFGVDVVLECTGRFRSAEQAGQHLQAGAKKVIISAPAKGDIKMVVLGVNEGILEASDTIISNASCTTNCLAPMAKVLDDYFGVDKGYATTVHAYTADQNLQDGPHSKDLRRARSAAMNIVPTTTNAGIALGRVFPKMEGRIVASAVRVPVVDGSLTELNCLLNKEVTVEEINAAFKEASEHELKGILQYMEDPIVSSDIIGNPYSSIFDAQLTLATGNFVKITCWYDNEYGYASRLGDLVDYIQKL